MADADDVQAGNFAGVDGRSESNLLFTLRFFSNLAMSSILPGSDAKSSADIVLLVVLRATNHTCLQPMIN
jgi:hypothetical protein